MIAITRLFKQFGITPASNLTSWTIFADYVQEHGYEIEAEAIRAGIYTSQYDDNSHGINEYESKGYGRGFADGSGDGRGSGRGFGRGHGKNDRGIFCNGSGDRFDEGFGFGDADGSGSDNQP